LKEKQLSGSTTGGVIDWYIVCRKMFSLPRYRVQNWPHSKRLGSAYFQAIKKLKFIKKGYKLFKVFLYFFDFQKGPHRTIRSMRDTLEHSREFSSRQCVVTPSSTSSSSSISAPLVTLCCLKICYPFKFGSLFLIESC